MLELKPVCEHCGTSLPASSEEAMICSFECTFCRNCATNLLQNVCPNCGGGFSNRPVRPSGLLATYPAQTEAFIRPVERGKIAEMIARFGHIDPAKR